MLDVLPPSANPHPYRPALFSFYFILFLLLLPWPTVCVSVTLAGCGILSEGQLELKAGPAGQLGLPVKLFIDLGWILELAAWCLQLRSWQSTIGNPYAINGCAWEICCGICSMQWEMYRFAILGSRLHNFFLIEWASHLTSQADSSTVFQKFTEHLFFVLKFRSL